MGCGRSTSSHAVLSVNKPSVAKEQDKKDPILDQRLFAVQNKGAIRDFYTFGQVLGKTQQGEVIEATNIQTKIQYAIKITSKYYHDNLLDIKPIINEFKLIKELDHPNIMKVYETFEDDRFIYTVMEKLSGEQTFSKLVKEDKIKQEDVALIIGQILNAISYLHSRNLCHRDIRPHSIAFDSKDGKIYAKIINFGTTKLFKRDKNYKETVGAPYFMAPEMIRKEAYSFKVDIWSLGVMAFLLSTGKLPFMKNDGKAEKGIKYDLEISKFEFNEDMFKPYPYLSNEFKDFINHCLQQKPDNRSKAASLLEHAWIKGNSAKVQLPENVLKEISTNMKHFNKLFMLERAVLSFISLTSTSEDDKMLRDLFISMDVNHDGKLNLDEFKQGFRKISPNYIFNEKEIEDIFTEVDTNKSDKIVYSEFLLAAVNKNKLIASSKLFSAFSYFDLSGDNKISKEEIKEIFHMGEIQLDEAALNQLITEIDSNKDSFISFEEFRNMMTKLVI